MWPVGTPLRNRPVTSVNSPLPTEFDPPATGFAGGGVLVRWAPSPQASALRGVAAPAAAEGLCQQHRAPGHDDPDRPEVVEIPRGQGGRGPDGDHDERDAEPGAPGIRRGGVAYR